MSERRLVVLSDRLAPATEWEAAIERRTGATVEVRSLSNQDALVQNADDAAVLIVGSVEPLDDEALGQLPGVGMIARRGAGLDNIDVAAAARRGVLVTNVPDASVEEVSDHALALATALCRRIALADRHTATGERAAALAAVDASRPMAELTFGVLGFGRIGRRAADKGQSLFGLVLAHDPFVSSSDDAVELVDRHELFTRSDVLSVHVPLTAETAGLVGQDELARLPEGAIVVNTARAEVLDEPALEQALVAGAVGGVGLDVSDQLSRWQSLREQGANVLLSGHTGARGQASQRNLRRTCADQVVAFLSGQRPAHVVTDR